MVSVAGQTYLIKKQISDDANMAIRVFEYSYAQALKKKTLHAGVIILPFPRAAVIYLEGSKVTPEQWEIPVVFPPDIPHSFKIQTVKLLEYSIEGIVEQGLSAFLYSKTEETCAAGQEYCGTARGRRCVSGGWD